MCLACNLRVIIWPLFAPSAWQHQDTVVAGTTGEGAALASVRSADVDSEQLWRLERQFRALVCALFALSVWDQTTTVVAGTSDEVAALASVRSVGVVSASHCGGGHVT